MKWKVFPKKTENLIEQLLINRGIRTGKEKEQFFHPKLSDFEDDLKIPGIDKANKRILQAIEKVETIIVYGDYDVDGICASAILYKGLTSIGAKVLPYIPHREKEGYGLSKMGLDFARDSGASLVITVDNGIVALEQAKYAKELGLDLIITDHHIPLNERPDAYAIVHSTKMCGASVAWCLIREIVSKSISEELLQFVAIATVCDVLPLIGLGRAFLVEGLRQIHKSTNLGLLSLVKECNINLWEIGSYEIGHILGPRLNAMGRLEHAIDSLRILCTKDVIKAKRLAKLLCETNIARQRMTQNALEQAKLLVNVEKKVHVLFSKDWSAGIIGLVAGRITDEYFKPTIAISVGEVVSKGSARSIDGINIVEFIRAHADILVDVGGHPGAAGFSILTKHIEIFKKRLEEHSLDFPQTEQVLEIDAEITSDQIKKSLVDLTAKFEPFGMDNPRPIFATHSMQVSDIRSVGEGKHLKFKVEDPEHVERPIDAIAFGMGNMANVLSSGQVVNIAYTPELDHYNSSFARITQRSANSFEKLQLKVKDLKLS